METAKLRVLKVNRGGYERRAAERYDDRMESAVKDIQRDTVADWLIRHHEPGSRMRVLSLPDRYWTFENRMNDRPNTSFVGLQRDWTTLEQGAPWIPRSNQYPSWADESQSHYFSAKAATGDVQGYRRGSNIVFHMWAGHMLSWDNLGDRKDMAIHLKAKSKDRRVTAAWLDFTGYLTDEVIAATAGIPVFLGGSQGPFPVVISFLACRDAFHDHEERVAHLLIALQKNQEPNWWSFRFDRFEVHSGTSPFISVFGDYSHCDRFEAASEPDNQGTDIATINDDPSRGTCNHRGVRFSMTPDDYRNRIRDPLWERGLAAHLRTLPANERLEFIRRFANINHPVAMDLIRKCVGDRISRAVLLDDALRDGSARTMQGWIDSLVKTMGAKKVTKHIAEKAEEYPSGVRLARYFLAGYSGENTPRHKGNASR